MDTRSTNLPFKTFEEYQNLRRQNPDLYYKTEVQKQLYEMHQQLGPQFFASHINNSEVANVKRL